jgi:hypothetical protein
LSEPRQANVRISSERLVDHAPFQLARPRSGRPSPVGRALICGALLLVIGRQPHEGLQLSAAVPPRARCSRRQVARLELTAPRRWVLTSLDDPASVSDLAATDTSPYAALAVAVGGMQGVIGNDLVRMDTASGELSPLLTRASGQESEEKGVGSSRCRGSATYGFCSSASARVPAGGERAGRACSYTPLYPTM